jgi:hypothetical protein
VEPPYTAAGANCTGDPGDACAGAIDEAMLTRLSYVRFPRAEPVPSFEKFDWVQTLDHHIDLYAEWPEPPSLEFLQAGGEISFDDFAGRPWWNPPRTMADLAEIGRKLESRGLTPVWADLTLDEARPLGFATKVSVPEMVPMSASHGTRWLGTPRLRAFASGDPPEFNPYPHPFP